MKLAIKKGLCPQNHKCPAVKACPVDALSQQGMAVPVVDEETCIACGKCAEACPTGALQMEEASA
jgi:Fe-S-cluster-containing hydrogenase component 2